MRLFVEVEAFDSITGDAGVEELRAAASKQIQHVQSSGKMVDGGIFVGMRGGYFFLDVDTAEEVFELLGGPMVDHFHVKIRPVVSFETLGKLFEKEAAEKASGGD